MRGVVFDQGEDGSYTANVEIPESDEEWVVRDAVVNTTTRLAEEMGVGEKYQRLGHLVLKHRPRRGVELSPVGAIALMFEAASLFLSKASSNRDIRLFLDDPEREITWQQALPVCARCLTLPIVSALSGDSPIVYLTDSQALALAHTTPPPGSSEGTFLDYPELPIFVLPPNNSLAAVDDNGIGFWSPRIVAPVRLTDDFISKVIVLEDARSGTLLIVPPPSIMGWWEFVAPLAEFAEAALFATSALGLVDAPLPADTPEMSTNRAARRRAEREHSKQAAMRAIENRLFEVSHRWLNDPRKVVSVSHERIEGTGRTVAPHWRKGHQRMVPYGPMDLAPRPKRPVMVGPVIVNAHLGNPETIVSYKPRGYRVPIGHVVGAGRGTQEEEGDSSE